MEEDKYFPGCHFNKPNDYLRLNLHQEVGWAALAKHGYICRKDITESATIVDEFNTKFPRMNDQSCTRKPVENRVSEDEDSNHIFDRRVHPP